MTDLNEIKPKDVLECIDDSHNEGLKKGKEYTCVMLVKETENFPKDWKDMILVTDNFIFMDYVHKSRFKKKENKNEIN